MGIPSDRETELRPKDARNYDGLLVLGPRVTASTKSGTQAATVPPPAYSWANPRYAVVQSSMGACHTDLVRALREGTPAETDAAENLNTMRLVFAAYESAGSGGVVPI